MQSLGVKTSGDELKDAVAQPSGLSITSSVGSVTVDDVHQGLTGQSFSASVGSISLPDIGVGFDGVSATFSVGSLSNRHVSWTNWSIYNFSNRRSWC